jgi:hypothetical protein
MKCEHPSPLTIAILTHHRIYWCRECGAVRDMYELSDMWELPNSAKCPRTGEEDCTCGFMDPEED